MSYDSNGRLNKIFWIIDLLIILYFVLDILAQILPPHYSPISQAESDLAVGKFGYLMTVNFLNRGVLSLLFIFAFEKALDLLHVPRTHFRAGSYLMYVWAIGSLLLAIFPTDVPPSPVSWHGAIHLIVAMIAFVGGALGTLAISFKLDKVNPLLSGLRRIAVPISAIVFLFWILEIALPFVLPHYAGKVGGASERLFLGSMLFWIASVSTYLGSRIPKIQVLDKSPA